MLVDSFKRSFGYLRLSLTEKCNFSCNYCLPDGSECHSLKQDLTTTEISHLVRAFAELGVEKIRLTGGEPSLRRDLTDIIQICKSTPGIKSVGMTTNGFRLLKDVRAWRAAGLDALNVSVDSLRPEVFQLITGSKNLKDILAGVDLASSLHFSALKLNAVLLQHYNLEEFESFLEYVRTRPVTLRFIELMQTGDNGTFFSAEHVDAQKLIQQLQNAGWVERVRAKHSGPAREFIHPNYCGAIGFILPYSPQFCADCNRLRVSSQGNLHLCLFAEQNFPLRSLLQSGDIETLKQAIVTRVSHKTAGHNLAVQNAGLTRHLAMLGG